MISLNRGEWSEIYAILSLLIDPKIKIVDSDLQFIRNDIFNIKSIVVEAGDAGEFVEYNLQNCGDIFVVQKFDVLSKLSSADLVKNKKAIYRGIKKAAVGGGAFPIKGIEELLDKFHRGKAIKAKSFLKADINTKIEDSIKQKEIELSYSIKSSLGSPATLLNASRRTNFIYKVTGLTTEQANSINAINSNSKLLDRIMAIYLEGGTITFHKVQDMNMEYNLKMIDTKMPEYLASALLYSYVSNAKDLDEAFIKSNNFVDDDMAKKKLGDLLKAISFGFFPSLKWDGSWRVNGGLIIVKNDGEVVALDLLYFEDEVIKYLTKETKLDSPSSTRYHMLELYEEDGDWFFTLNLQIRYKR